MDLAAGFGAACGGGRRFRVDWERESLVLKVHYDFLWFLWDLGLDSTDLGVSCYYFGLLLFFE